MSAAIQYVPICSHCKQKIEERVSYEQWLTHQFPFHKAHHIKPEQCPYCGEHFDSITVSNVFEEDLYE